LSVGGQLTVERGDACGGFVLGAADTVRGRAGTVVALVLRGGTYAPQVGAGGAAAST
jgi:ribosomal protein L13